MPTLLWSAALVTADEFVDTHCSFLKPTVAAEGVALALSVVNVFGFGHVGPLLDLLDFKCFIHFRNFAILFTTQKLAGRRLARQQGPCRAGVVCMVCIFTSDSQPRFYCSKITLFCCFGD